MRADYDSESDTSQIELVPVRKPGHAENVENGAVIVSIHEDRPVMVNVIGTGNGFEGPLRVAAERYELDAEALIAAARAARAALAGSWQRVIGGRKNASTRLGARFAALVRVLL